MKTEVAIAVGNGIVLRLKASAIDDVDIQA